MGGKFGFVSSHAANFAGITTFIILNFKPQRFILYTLLLTHLLVTYSRVYLGVHYVADVAVGTVLGVVFGWLVYQVYKKVNAAYQNL
jgi:undecaprenyl-diphosphatase